MDAAFKVCVRCFTYNHANYIENALNGFTMQETTFPYICAIVDDASSDGEPEKIEHYLKNHFDIIDGSGQYLNIETDDYRMIYARHKINPNCFFAVYLLKYNHYRAKKNKMQYIAEWCDNAPYIAICEGDDFWIDSSKLQKQFDYMSGHPNCTMCCHNAYWLTIGEDNNSAKLFNNYNSDRDLSIEDVISHWVIPTASVMVKRDYNINPSWMPAVYCGDFARILNCINEGDIHFLSIIASVYRYNVLKNSSSLSSMHNSMDIMNAHYKLLVGFAEKASPEFKNVLDHRIKELDDSIKLHTYLAEKRYGKLLLNSLLVLRTLWGKIR